MAKKVFHHRVASRTRKNSTFTVGGERVRFYGLTALWSILIGVSLYIFLWSPVLVIQEVQVIGIDETTAATVTQRVEQFTQGKRWDNIAVAHLLFFPSAAVTTLIYDEFVHTQDVKLTRIFPNTIVLHITEIDVIRIACPPAGEGHADYQEGCYELNEFGVATRSVDFSQERYTQNETIIIDVANSDSLQMDHNVLSQDILAFITKFDRDIVYSLGIKSDDRYTMSVAGNSDFSIVTDEGWMLNVDAASDSDRVLTYLRILFEQTDLGVDRTDLEYIDVRFDDKIFYKEKDIEPESVPVEVDTKHETVEE